MAGKLARSSLNDLVPIAFQYLNVAHRRRVGIHVKIHGRRNEHRSLHGEICGNKQIIGNTRSHLAQCGCSCRRNNHGIGPKTELDVTVP